MAQIDNSNQVIDSRDLIARIEELESDRQTLVDTVEEAETNHAEDSTEEHEDDHYEAIENAKKELADWDDSEDAEELKSLQEFAEEASQYSSDWTYGETLVNEDYWVDYCREMVSDIGDMPREIPSYIVIDWDATADNLAADYVRVDFDGTTYYLRNS